MPFIWRKVSISHDVLQSCCDLMLDLFLYIAFSLNVFNWYGKYTIHLMAFIFLFQYISIV